MKYKIYGIDELDNSDSFIIEEKTIEDCQKVARHETSIRKWRNCWSERL